MTAEILKAEAKILEPDDIQLVTAIGEIDIYSAPMLKATIARAFDSGAKDLVLDMSNVTYLDSSGLGVLLGAVRRAKPKGGTVNLIGCTDATLRILDITNLRVVFGIFQTIREAREAIRTA